MFISTDAISLDGLLDAVSCGSNFSCPPSPVQYQNKNTMTSNTTNSISVEDYKKISIDQPCTVKSCDDRKKYDFKLMKSQTDIRINHVGSIYTNQIRNVQQCGRNKTSSLIGVYENMSNKLKTSEHDTKVHRNTLQSQTSTSKIFRTPTYSLSLPRKPLSNSQMVPVEDNILIGKKFESNVILSNKTEEISNVQLPKSHPPYYCLPVKKSTPIKNSSIANDIPSGNSLNQNTNFKDIKEKNPIRETQQVVPSIHLSNLCYESSHIKGYWKNEVVQDRSSNISVSTQKQSDIRGNNGSVGDISKLGNSNETVMAQEDLGSNPKSNLNRPINKQRQIQLQLKQNPQTRQLFAVIQEEAFQPRPPNLYSRNDELSDSYASLECPSPPGPPSAIPDLQSDAQNRLANYLRGFYQELIFKEQSPPKWSSQPTGDALSAARFEPDLRLNSNSHGINDYLTVDQILTSIQTKDGNFLEAPRRCLIECPSWTSRKNLGLRVLHAWSKGTIWPAKGVPIGLTLFIPLLEIKRSIAHFLEKELLPKGNLNPLHNIPGGFCGAWRSLEAMGPKLLIILDGYTSQKHSNILSNYQSSPRKLKGSTFESYAGLSILKSQIPSDVYDLLDGKLFPEARILILTNCSNCLELMPIIQRHIMYEGLTWGRSASILEGGHWGGPSHLINLVRENLNLRKAIRTPLGCLAIAAIYENSNGHLPVEELDVIEAIFNCVASQVSSSNVSELGRLALFCLKRRRTYVTLSEIKMYCSTPTRIVDCFEKDIFFGKTANRKSEYVFHPICEGMLEYLAANYIASLVYKEGLLSAEIMGLAISDEIDADILKVLKYSMTLLGDQAHVLLSKLTPLWLSPQTVFSLALSGSYCEDNMAALCDILGISKHPPISPLETKPLWVQVRSAATDLMGWGMALKSTTCTLKNLELIYQLEKQNLAESRKALDIFLESMANNESVLTLRLSSLIEMDVKDSEINFLANCVSNLLLKPRLENFELVLTLIEEDPPMLKLQSVVTALCRSLPRQTKLNSLLLDLGLCTSQLVQICAALDKCPNLTRLSMPHLRCEKGAVSTVASLIKSRSINFLSLPSCWGARDDPPSSSGISMGSGSGSSTTTSCLIKQGSLPGVPSPKTYAPGVFSSLPRGIFVPQTSLGRSATLPRQPLDQTVEKHSSESVVSKIWYPTPSCEGMSHNSGTLHELFVTIRDSYSKLHGLDLSKAQFTLEDSMCLGESIRMSKTLHTLKLEGLSRISDILPSILGASESPCLQMLSIGSQRLCLDDSTIVMCARSLSSCPALRLLSIDGWTLKVEHSQTLSILQSFLSLTSVRELSMASCRLHTSLIKMESNCLQLFESRSVVVLKLSGAQIILPDSSVIRGPKLLKFIGVFPCLRELDLSSPARSAIENSHSSSLILDDKTIIHFFQNLHSYFGLLNTLKMCNWVIHMDDMSKTIKTIGKALRNSPISHLKMDGIVVLDRPKKKRCESTFIQCIISSLPLLRWMGISLSGKKEDQVTSIAGAITDLKGFEIEIKLSESTIEQAKLMAQVLSLDGKFDIKVSTFGTSSGILIHAEKCGIKSLNRKNKEKEHI